MNRFKSSGWRPLTLRNLPADVARAVNLRAERDGISLNKAVIRLLEEALGLQRLKPDRLHHDLDAFIGVLSKEEARILEEAVGEERKIEPEFWR